MNPAPTGLRPKGKVMLLMRGDDVNRFTIVLGGSNQEGHKVWPSETWGKRTGREIVAGREKQANTQMAGKLARRTRTGESFPSHPTASTRLPSLVPSRAGSFPAWSRIVMCPCGSLLAARTTCASWRGRWLRRPSSHRYKRCWQSRGQTSSGGGALSKTKITRCDGPVPFLSADGDEPNCSLAGRLTQEFLFESVEKQRGPVF